MSNVPQPKSDDDIFVYDSMVADKCGTNLLVVGPQAVMRNGLTTTFFPTLTLGWDIKEWKYIPALFVWWFYTPHANDFRDTRPSPFADKIRIPSAERALLDYMENAELYGTSYLVEGLQSYYAYNDVEKLYKLAFKYDTPKQLIDKWLQIAHEMDGM